MQHSISHEWVNNLDNGNSAWRIINFVFMLSRTSVPIFFMCSGIGMLGRERSFKEIYTKNIWELLRIYICWMVIYGLYDAYRLCCGSLATPRTIINVFIKNIIFGRYHTWFLVALIGLYAITPYLYLIVKYNVSYFICLSILFTIVFPYLARVEELGRLYKVIENVNMNFVVGYTLYFVVGYYLYQIRLTKKVKIATIICLGISSLLGYLLSCHNVLLQGAACQEIYNEFSLFGFTMSITIFLLFRILFDKKEGKVSKRVLDISRFGIGIYLIHPLFLPFVTEIHGVWVVCAGFLLWLGMVLIMKIISMCPGLRVLLIK